MLTQTSPQAFKKIFTFSAGSETFGLPLHLLHEVIYPEHITRVPKAPAFMAGILTYGSETIPVLDISKKLCLAAPSIRVHHPAIIINTIIEDETMQLALLVERFGKIVQYKNSETIKRKIFHSALVQLKTINWVKIQQHTHSLEKLFGNL